MAQTQALGIDDQRAPGWDVLSAETRAELPLLERWLDPLAASKEQMQPKPQEMAVKQPRPAFLSPERGEE